MSSEEPDWIRPAGTEPNAPRSPHARCIVSAGIGRYYRERLRSTVNHCAVHCPETWRLFYDCLPDGCPPHYESQYAFKIYALKRAIDAGFRYVLWMDTSFQPIASIEPLWAAVSHHGWFIPKQGSAMLGSWTSEAALTLYNIDHEVTREQLMNVPLCYSGIVALDMQRVGRQIWDQWYRLYRFGAFNGPHYQGENECPIWSGHKSTAFCSADPRCEGHRHDESALSFVLHTMGITPMTSGLLTLDSEQGIIGHGVPDYDVRTMHEHLMDYADENASEFPKLSEAIHRSCR